MRINSCPGVKLHAPQQCGGVAAVSTCEFEDCVTDLTLIEGAVESDMEESFQSTVSTSFPRAWPASLAS